MDEGKKGNSYTKRLEVEPPRKSRKTSSNTSNRVLWNSELVYLRYRMNCFRNPGNAATSFKEMNGNTAMEGMMRFE